MDVNYPVDPLDPVPYSLLFHEVSAGDKKYRLSAEWCPTYLMTIFLRSAHKSIGCMNCQI